MCRRGASMMNAAGSVGTSSYASSTWGETLLPLTGSCEYYAIVDLLMVLTSQRLLHRQHG